MTAAVITIRTCFIQTAHIITVPMVHLPSTRGESEDQMVGGGISVVLVPLFKNYRYLLGV